MKATSVRLLAAIACSVVVGSSNVLAQATEFKIQAGVAISGAEFGTSVCIDGDYAIVGAPGENSNQGAAYIFKRNYVPLLWLQVSKLTASNGKAGDKFGTSVSINGNYALVGASNAYDLASTNTGAAYVFKKPTGGWPATTLPHTAILYPHDGSAGDNFGYSVSISTQRAIVGAPQHDLGASYPLAGVVYFFDEPAWPLPGWSGWTSPTVKKGAFSPSANDQFGYSVCISGDYAVVGSPWVDDTYQNSGAAYIFSRPNQTIGWNQISKLTAADAQGDHRFGWSVSIAGDYALVGAFLDDDQPSGPQDAGAAYVFTRPPATGWVDNAGSTKLTASNPAIADHLGFSVSVSGDMAVAGARYARTVYGFRKPATPLGWTVANETLTETASTGLPGDGYAQSVSVSGVCTIVGAREEDSPLLNCGAAYIYCPLKKDLCIPDSDYDDWAEPNGSEAFVSWHSTSIWNRNTNSVGSHQNPVLGQNNYLFVSYKNRGPALTGVINVYITKSAVGNIWPGSWTKPGSFIGSFAVNPATGADGSDYVTWAPPAPGSYCIYAEFVSTPATDDPLAFPLVSWHPDNVRNNNNIAARNVEVVFKKNISSELIIRNPEVVAANIALEFVAPQDELADNCLDDIIWYVNLGDMRVPWEQGGEVSSGMEPVVIEQDTVMRILDPTGAWLENMPFDSGAEYTISVQVDLPEEPLARDSGMCAFDIVEHSAPQLGGDPIIRVAGGMRYLLDIGRLSRHCCVGQVGDANGSGEDIPTIGDISVMIDALFISADMGVIACLAEADINQSGGGDPLPNDITIGDISILIDYLFITGQSLGLAECL